MSEIVFDYRKLMGRIKEICNTQAVFAGKIGISAAGLSARLNNKTDFSPAEIMRSCAILRIPVDEIPQYFFCKNSSETRTTAS